jgi:hypothetical protein
MAQASINIPQLRRDAKRLARTHNISHSQALDQLARSRGYPNWSQLAKRGAAVLPEPVAAKLAPALTGAAVRELLGLPKMEITTSEQKTIMAIVKRYCDVVGDALELRPISIMLDLKAVHSNGCPLDLDALLAAPRDSDLIHDVAGIGRYLNRETGKLEEGFTPRYARSSIGSLANA